MKKLLTLVSLALLVAACQVEEDYLNERVSAEVVLYATIEDETAPETKVYADAQMKVLWNQDDRITVFNRYTYNDQFYFKGEDGDNAGAFGMIPREEMLVTGNDLPYLYSVYPYAANTKISNSGIITYYFPAQQEYKPDSFGIRANTMVSVTDENALKYRNAGGYLSFRLYGDGVAIKRLTLKGNNGEKLAGKAQIFMEVNGTPVVTMDPSATETLTLNCETPVMLNTSAQEYLEFWMVLPPTEFEQGITFTAYDDHGAFFEKQTTRPITIERSTLTHMAALEVVMEGGEANPSDPIAFADANVKQALLSKGIDTNQDGEISYEEAAAVTTIGKNFFGAYKTAVQSFDEFRFFTSVTRIEADAFSDTSIESIQLPEHLEVIGQSAFARCRVLRAIQLPESLTTLGQYAFLGCYELKDLTLSPNLRSVDTSVFAYCTALEEVIVPEGMTFIGDYMFSECSGIKHLHLAQSVKKIGSRAFGHCSSLESVTGGEGLTEMGSGCFCYCSSLKTFHIPEGVDTFGSENPFFACTSLESLSGKYVASDGRSLIKNNSLIAFAFAGAVNVSYQVPSNVTSIAEFAFYLCDQLVSVTLPDRLMTLGYGAFSNCTNLQSITLPASVRYIGGCCFSECTSLEVLEFPEGIDVFEAQLCYGCTALQKVTIPKSITKFYNNVFTNCTALSEVICKSTTPPALRSSKYTNYDEPQDSFTNTPEDMRILVPSGSVELYRQAETWSIHASQIEGVDFPDMDNPDFYISTDYSQDGVPFTIQTATEGAGINLVFMGDCFVDTDIADGSYRANLEHAADVFFAVEPYASYRHLFNVYGVNVVSATEGYSYTTGKLGTYFGSGTHVGGNDSVVQEYARKALPSADFGKVLIIVMMNRPYYAGTCYMYYNRTGDYGQGLSIAYFPLGTDDTMFAGLVQHEAGGHGFAKLADEYNYSEPISDDTKASYQSQEPYGWWRNVDFTADPTLVKWNSFLQDSRYSQEQLGVYEGACTYATGAYRPSVNSIMRYNTGGFNAPSREAIYYRIHKLAYGDSWQYDREAFVEYDAVNRAQSFSAWSSNAYWEQLPPLAPPVVIEDK